MSRTNVKRFFEASDFESADGGFAVTLDGRRVKTPGGVPLILPEEGLAAAIAAEWAAQEDTIRPDTMPITGLSCTAVDTVASQRAAIVDQLVKYAESDLLCYRADQPDDLREHQQTHWQPLLDWASETHGAGLVVTTGILPVDQPTGALASLRRAVEAQDDFHLTVLASVTQAAGSLVIGLCVIGGRLNAGQAFDASQLDETWQTDTWGEDAEAVKRRVAIRQEIRDAIRFLDLVRGGQGS
jgi:chaperone required for assembly of F1-ATPase